MKKQVKAIEIVHPHHLRFVPMALAGFFDLLATRRRPPAGLSRRSIRRRSAATPLKSARGPGTVSLRALHARHRTGAGRLHRLLAEGTLVKRLVLKSVPEPATRLAMLKQQEADVTYAIYSTLGEDVRRDPSLKLEPTLAGIQWGLRRYV